MQNSLRLADLGSCADAFRHQAKGLEPDFSCRDGHRDKFGLHLTNLFAKQFGQACRASKIRVPSPEVEGTAICRADMKAAAQPVVNGQPT